MDKFVVGFAFTERGSVLLIQKKRPAWQSGCLNGIGGKIEDGETPEQAMTRECLEETGLTLEWGCRGVMEGANNDGNPFECYIFYAYDNGVNNFQQIEDEPLGVYLPSLLGGYKLIDNLNFLIPYGLSKDARPYMTLTYGDSAVGDISKLIAEMRQVQKFIENDKEYSPDFSLTKKIYAGKISDALNVYETAPPAPVCENCEGEAGVAGDGNCIDGLCFKCCELEHTWDFDRTCMNYECRYRPTCKVKQDPAARHDH